MRSRWPVVVLVLSLLLFVPGVLARSSALFLFDDAFVFSRYADHWLSEGRFCWNPGDRPTYGATSPAYLLLVTGMTALLPDRPGLVLWTAGACGGVAFLCVLYALLRRQSDAHPALVALVMAPLGLSPGLVGVATSGMDTTLAMTCVTGYLLALHACHRSCRARSAIAVGAAGGLMYLVRPELLLPTLLMPMGLLLFGGTTVDRRGLWVLLAAAAGGLAIAMGLTTHFLGSPLPLSFYGKTLPLYGEAFNAWYESLENYWFAYIPRAYTWLFAIFATSLGLRLYRRSWSVRPFDRALWLVIVVFAAYVKFGVTQVMGYHGRFLHPLLPALAFLALREALFIGTSLSELRPRGATWRDVRVLLAIGAAAFLAAPMAGQVRQLVTSRDLGIVCSFRVDTAYDRRIWFALDQVSRLPDELVMAATEVGWPGVMNPEKALVNMAGLTEPVFARRPFSVDTLIDTYAPDWIYMPDPDYVDMTRNMLGSDRFVELYRVEDGRRLGTRLGVAVRRNSRYYSEMVDLLEHARRGASWAGVTSVPRPPGRGS